MGNRQVTNTIVVKEPENKELYQNSIILSFRYETFSFDPETAKELGEALVAEAEEQLEDEGN